MDAARKLGKIGLNIYATEKTSDFLSSHGIKNTRVYKISEKKDPSVLDLIRKGKLEMAINISDTKVDYKGSKDGFLIRRNCVDYSIPLITNLQSAIILASAISSKKMEDLKIKSWDEYN